MSKFITFDKSPEDLIDQGAVHNLRIRYKCPSMDPKWRVHR